jgi:hypothetical protein
MGPQREYAEVYATLETTPKSAESVFEPLAESREQLDTDPALEAIPEHAMADRESSVSGGQKLLQSDSLPQNQSKVASIFPSLERGAFRRPVTTKSSQSVKDGAEDETIDRRANRQDAMQASEAPIATTDNMDSGHTANSLLTKEQPVTATTTGPSERATRNDLQAPSVSYRSAEGNRKDSEDAQDTQAETMEADLLMREIPIYAPVPLHEQPSALISSSPDAMCVDRQPSPESSCELRRSPSIRRPRNSPLPRSLEDDMPSAQSSRTPLPSIFGGPSGIDKGAISPPRTPLQPIAEHEPVDRAEKTISSETMDQGHGMPRLEMNLEHFLPRPETPIRKFTDNALARQAWPTLDQYENQDLEVRKRDTARPIERGMSAEAIRTPEKSMPILRPSSVGSIKSVHSAHSSQRLRRMDRSTSGDLRAASQAQEDDRQSSRSPQPPFQPPPSDLNIERIASSSSYDPVTDKGKRPLRAMTDVYVSIIWSPLSFLPSICYCLLWLGCSIL